MSFINHKRKYIQTLLAPGYEPFTHVFNKPGAPNDCFL